MLNVRIQSMEEELQEEIGAFSELTKERRKELKELDQYIDTHSGIRPGDLINTQRKMYHSPSIGAETYYVHWDNIAKPEDLGKYFDQQIDTESHLAFS